MIGADLHSFLAFYYNNHYTNNYKPPIVKLYINGEKVGENTFDKLLNIKKQKYIYLGVGDPEREQKNNWFKGTIDTFATYSKALSDIYLTSAALYNIPFVADNNADKCIM